MGVDSVCVNMGVCMYIHNILCDLGVWCRVSMYIHFSNSCLGRSERLRVCIVRTIGVSTYPRAQASEGGGVRPLFGLVELWKSSG